MSLLAATLGLELAGVIGLYGTLAGPWRNDAPAPLAALLGRFPRTSPHQHDARGSDSDEHDSDGRDGRPGL